MENNNTQHRSWGLIKTILPGGARVSGLVPNAMPVHSQGLTRQEKRGLVVVGLILCMASICIFLGYILSEKEARPPYDQIAMLDTPFLMHEIAMYSPDSVAEKITEIYRELSMDKFIQYSGRFDHFADLDSFLGELRWEEHYSHMSMREFAGLMPQIQEAIKRQAMSHAPQIRETSRGNIFWNWIKSSRSKRRADRIAFLRNLVYIFSTTAGNEMVVKKIHENREVAFITFMVDPTRRNIALSGALVGEVVARKQIADRCYCSVPLVTRVVNIMSASVGHEESLMWFLFRFDEFGKEKRFKIKNYGDATEQVFQCLKNLALEKGCFDNLITK
ncbi:MAG: hypothetical protein ACI83D_000367 [Planctomycetota bacterium]|jgi:hypothetical protein